MRYGSRLLDDLNGNGNNYCVPGCPTPVCPAGTPIPIVTPAFTPGPGCATQPGPNVLTATITTFTHSAVAVFNNTSTTCSYPIGFASYRKFDANIADQQLYDYSLDVIPPQSAMTLTLSLPPCAYDTDAFYGPIIASFAGGARYGTRLLATTASVGLDYCPCGSPTPVPPQPTATPEEATATPIATDTPVVACTINFSDVSADNPFYAYVRCLVCHGIASGYPDSTFRPGASVTRGQVAKIIANSANLTTAVPPGQQTFADVPEGSTFWLWIERAAKAGLVSGYPCGGPNEECVAPINLPYFRPSNNVTRAQLAKIAATAAGFSNPVSGQTFADVPANSPFYAVVERMAARGIITGYPCGGAGEGCNAARQPYYRPNNNLTRGQMAKIASVTFFPNCAVTP